MCIFSTEELVDRVTAMEENTEELVDQVTAMEENTATSEELGEGNVYCRATCLIHSLSRSLNLDRPNVEVCIRKPRQNPSSIWHDCEQHQRALMAPDLSFLGRCRSIFLVVCLVFVDRA